MPRLTQKIVNSARPGEKEDTVWDGPIPGFGLRVRPTGHKTYVFQYRPRGGSKVRKITIGNANAVSLEDARQEAARLWREVALRNDPARVTSDRRANTVESAFAEYDQVHLCKTAKDYRLGIVSVFKRLIFPQIGDKPLAEVTRGDIYRITDRILAKQLDAAANHAHHSVSAFLSWCLNRQLIDFNPLLGAQPPAPRPSRSRVLTKEELVGRRLHWQIAGKPPWTSTHPLASH